MPKVSKGSVYNPKGTNNWSIRFQLDGRDIRETGGTDNREAAVASLRRRVGEAKRGCFLPVSERVTFEEMHQLLLDSYEFKGNRTDPGRYVRRLAKSFEKLAGDELTEERIQRYARKRIDDDGKMPSTVRRELAVLERMLRLSSARLQASGRAQSLILSIANRGPAESAGPLFTTS